MIEKLNFPNLRKRVIAIAIDKGEVCCGWEDGHHLSFTFECKGADYVKSKIFCTTEDKSICNMKYPESEKELNILLKAQLS